MKQAAGGFAGDAQGLQFACVACTASSDQYPSVDLERLGRKTAIGLAAGVINCLPWSDGRSEEMTRRSIHRPREQQPVTHPPTAIACIEFQ
jgi:hypothetical protein